MGHSVLLMPTAKSRTKTASPSCFLDGRKGEPSDDLAEWEPACTEGGRQE